MRRMIAYLQNPRHLAAAISIVSAAALADAYIAQYVFGLKPCILCLYQRVPYFVNIAFGGLACLATFRFPRLIKPLIVISALIFFAGALIAGFHAGVEYGWWKGLPSCGGDIVPTGVSLEALRAALTHQEVVRCDKPAWTLFHISMAGYNFFLSLALGLGIVYLLKKKQDA